MAETAELNMINGTARTVRQLFSGRKYGLDYYQREYTWTQANVEELLSDLLHRFENEFDPADERRRVEYYRPYFLGPIVTSSAGGVAYLVDGQQRLTTVTLLLIHLQHLLETIPDTEDLGPLIYSLKFGTRSFNINVAERDAVMHAIFNGSAFDPADESESVRNIWARFQDVVDYFSDSEAAKAAVLPYFVDWLLDRVVFVEIITTDEAMALEIFESMNDRGLRLSNTDMLKSYLLSRIRNEQAIEQSNQMWRRQVTALEELERNADSEFLKTWLRGKFADSIRERKKDAAARDFDVIGTAFHKWVRDNTEKMGLATASDFERVVTHDFRRMSEKYMHLLRVSQAMSPGWEHVFYNARNGLTLQYLPILAAVTPEDDAETFQSKTRLVAGYLDIFVARRMVNFRNFGYSTIVYTIFNLARDLRDRGLDELREVLADRVADLPERFEGVENFRLTQRNRSHILYLLARMTAWIEVRSGRENRFPMYMDRTLRKPFEVEHIWANKFERHAGEFANAYEFGEFRDRFGDLLLLEKDFNASYGAKPYEEKLPHYHARNLLAASLHPLTYENNPGFREFVASSDLPLKPYPEGFSRSDIDERQELYRQICERVWDPAQLGLDGGASASGQSHAQRKAFYGVSLRDLIDANLVIVGDRLTGERSGERFTAEVIEGGRLRLADGRVFDSLSGAADHLTGRSNNGWEFWSVDRAGGTKELADIRLAFLAAGSGTIAPD